MTNKDKGKLLEGIIHKMYLTEGQKVEKNVFLPSINHTSIADKKRRREFDIIITNRIANIDIIIAIECKNENKKIGINKIDSFVGKLKDVGIPSKLGIYVSTNGYTTGAIERANKEGIKTLVLENIDNLSTMVSDAIQSTVFYIVNVNEIRITNQSQSSQGSHLFYNNNNELCGTIFDLVRYNWFNDDIPLEVGTTDIDIKIPDNWKQKINNKLTSPISISASIEIFGVYFWSVGQSKKNILTNINSKTVEKYHCEVSFNDKQSISIFNSKFSLDNFLKNFNIKIISKIKAPRIICNCIYWPPSINAINKLNELGFDNKFELMILSEIEGTDIKTIWEPIYPEYLSLVENIIW